MKKSRILSVFLTVCLLVSLVPAMEQEASAAAPTKLIIAGEDVTGGGSGNGWSYDGAGTLTLSGANITADEESEWYKHNPDTESYCAIFCEGTLTIVLESGTTNSVVVDNENADFLCAMLFADVSGAGLTFRGDGRLNIIGGTCAIQSTGLECIGSLTVAGGTIQSTGSYGSGDDSTMSSVGISQAGGSVTISGGSLAATGGPHAYGSTGFVAISPITVNGGQLIAMGGGGAAASSIGIETAEPVTVIGSFVRAVGGDVDAAGTGRSIAIAKTGEFTGAPINIACGELQLDYDTSAETGFACGAVTNTARGGSASISGAGESSIGVGAASGTLQKSGSETVVVSLNVPTELYVGGENVTSGGSGAGWSYNGYGTLTLSGANITGARQYNTDTYAGIHCVGGDLYMVLSDGTTSTVHVNRDSTEGVIAVASTQGLTIRGGGTLTAQTSGSCSIATGIGTASYLQINGGTINSIVDAAATFASAAIYIEGEGSVLEINGGTVNAVAASAAQISAGIGSMGAITITGGSVSASGDASATALGGAITGSSITNGAPTDTIIVNGANELTSIAAGETAASSTLTQSGVEPVVLSFEAPAPEPDPDEPADPTDPMRGNVYGQYVAGGTIDVISVDIEWGSMRFAYSSEAVQIWIPEEHDYSGEPATGWTPLDKNGDLLTITNHSNVDVEIGIVAESKNAGVSTINFMVEEKGIADYEGDYVLQRGQEGGYDSADYLMLAAEPVGTLQDTDATFGKIADVTVTIAKYEAP